MTRSKSLEKQVANRVMTTNRLLNAPGLWLE